MEFCKKMTTFMFFIPPTNNWSTGLGFYTCISTKYQLSLQSCTYKLSIHSRWIIASKVGRNYCFILLSYHIIHIYIFTTHQQVINEDSCSFLAVLEYRYCSQQEPSRTDHQVVCHLSWLMITTWSLQKLQ